jgi:hypothetical protein
MDSSAFNRLIPEDIVEILVACFFVAAVITTIVLLKEPSAVSLPTKDFVCTESAIVNGSAECVEYRRKEK